LANNNNSAYIHKLGFETLAVAGSVSGEIKEKY